MCLDLSKLKILKKLLEMATSIHSKIYNFNDKTKSREIKSILQKLSNKEQLLVGIEDEGRSDERLGNLLIQRTGFDGNEFLACEAFAYTSTPWRKISIEALVEIIMATKSKSLKKLEKWKPITQAIEGKILGDY